MKAEEARKLTHDHSKRMQKIYKSIEDCAKQGNNELYLHTGDATMPELEVLRKNGFTAGYETSETDGGQFIVIKW
jgi:hypothetical protein